MGGGEEFDLSDLSWVSIAGKPVGKFLIGIYSRGN